MSGSGCGCRVCRALPAELLGDPNQLDVVAGLVARLAPGHGQAPMPIVALKDAARKHRLDSATVDDVIENWESIQGMERSGGMVRLLPLHEQDEAAWQKMREDAMMAPGGQHPLDLAVAALD